MSPVLFIPYSSRACPVAAKSNGTKLFMDIPHSDLLTGVSFIAAPVLTLTAQDWLSWTIVALLLINLILSAIVNFRRAFGRRRK
jgi:hypothetical protein